MNTLLSSRNKVSRFFKKKVSPLDSSTKTTTSMRSLKKPAVERFPIMIWLLSMTLLIPLMVGADFNLRDSPQEINSKSIETRMFAVAALSVCFALLVDLILDYIFFEDNVYNYFGLRAFSLVSLGSFSLAYIVAANFDNFGAIYVSLDTAQVFGEVGCLLWLMNSLNSLGCFTQLRIAIVLGLYYLNFLMWDLNCFFSDGDPSSLLHILSDVFYNASAVTFLILCINYVYHMRKQMIQNKINQKPLHLEHYYCNIVVGCVLAAVILNSILVFVISAIYNTDNSTSFVSAPYRDGQFIIRTALTYFLCLLPGRMFKRKAAETNYDNEVKSSFVSYMSHEIRTPLSVIEMGLTLLSSQIKEGCEAAALTSTVEDVEQACSEAAVVLDNLLLYEKLDKNTLKLNQVEVLAISFLYQSLEAVEKQTKPIDARLKVLSDSDIETLANVQVTVDKVVLSAQLLKVVKRALYRATESSLVTIRMQVLEEALHPAQALGNSMRKQPPSDGGLVCISVSLVTPLSEEEKLMFSEGKLQFAREARDCDGCSALSMWLAKKSFMLHGGRLRLETNTDGEVLCMDLPFERTPIPMLPLALKSLKTKFAGMMLSKARKQSDNPLPTFSLQLPKTRRSILKMNANTVTAAGLTADFKLIVCPTSTPVVEDRKRLLVVDDSEMNRKMVIRLMTSLGYTCDEAEDGSIAHKMVVESMQGGVSYEFVLMDNEMPVMRGRDAVKKMRASGFTNIILGVTGNAKDEEVADFKTSGADDVIVKPMTLLKLTAVMKELNYHLRIR